MMYKILFKAIAAAVFLGVIQVQDLSAQDYVSTGAPFLLISPDARSGGMADAGIAISPDANAIFRNQAKTSFATQKASAGATYIPWLRDMADGVFFTSVAGYYKPTENSAVSGGVRYFNMGTINYTTDGITSAGSQRPYQYAIDAGYSLKVSDYLGVGVTFRYINSSILQGSFYGKAYNKGNAIAGDISLFYNKLNKDGHGFAAGLTLANLGSKINYSGDAGTKMFLPANLGIGAAYTFSLQDKSNLTLAADITHLLVPAYDSTNGQDYYQKTVVSGIGSSFNNKHLQLSGGAEYNYNGQVYVRAGYHWETKAAGDSKYLTAGVGIGFAGVVANFSYLAQAGKGMNRNPLANTLKFSLLYNLAK